MDGVIAPYCTVLGRRGIVYVRMVSDFLHASRLSGPSGTDRALCETRVTCGVYGVSERLVTHVA